MVKKTAVSTEVSAYFSKMGKKSSSKLTPEERKARAKKAAKTLWDKRKTEEKGE
jgi:hypothetical protein